MHLLLVGDYWIYNANWALYNLYQPIKDGSPINRLIYDVNLMLLSIEPDNVVLIKNTNSVYHIFSKLNISDM